MGEWGIDNPVNFSSISRHGWPNWESVTVGNESNTLDGGNVCTACDVITTRGDGLRLYAYRWTPGAILTWSTDRDSFPDDDKASLARYGLERAAAKWNEGKIGVTFKEVEDDQPALIRLTYKFFSREKPTLMAEAFFPGSLGDQRLYVYELSFRVVGSDLNSMAGVLCHELGHILGLRHEFAQEAEAERLYPSYLLGQRNGSSIMNYFEKVSDYRIQEDDYHHNLTYIGQTLGKRNLVIGGFMACGGRSYEMTLYFNEA
ncbi:hypothetical protein F5Y11DRAFT_344704 [Daldinia sp. FL1419]|nr:hypothetical protein F5Y11DRAFT_344704 [Daldinia sp. FL1419]